MRQKSQAPNPCFIRVNPWLKTKNSVLSVSPWCIRSFFTKTMPDDDAAGFRQHLLRTFLPVEYPTDIVSDRAV